MATVRRAGVEDAADVARLLHDFNTEYDDYTPGVEALTERAESMIAAGETTFLLGGAKLIDLGTSEDDTAAQSLYESAGFTNREGRPDGPRMLYYERRL